MKLLFISDNFPPEFNAPATRTYEHCREWVKNGMDVTVITCAPNFPKGELFEGYQNKLYQKEVIDGIKVIRVWSYISANKGFFKRVIDFVSFAVMSSFFGLFQKCDVVITTSPQFFTNFSGFFLKLIKRKPWILEVRDIWPESIRSVGALKNDKIYNFLEKLELFFYRFCDKIVVVTNSFKENISSRGISKSKIEVIFNGVDLSIFESKSGKQKTEDSGNIIVGYVGTHGMAHNLSFVLDCAVELQSNYPQIKLLFVGEGSEKLSLIEKSKNLGLKNVEFRSSIPKNQIPSLLEEIDVGLINLSRNDTFKTVIPSKMFEISAVGKPIYMGVEGEAKKIVEEFDAGICFVPESVESFLDNIPKLLKKCEQFSSAPDLSKSLSRAFDRKKLAQQMSDVIKTTSS